LKVVHFCTISWSVNRCRYRPRFVGWCTYVLYGLSWCTFSDISSRIPCRVTLKSWMRLECCKFVSNDHLLEDLQAAQMHSHATVNVMLTCHPRRIDPVVQSQFWFHSEPKTFYLQKASGRKRLRIECPHSDHSMLRMRRNTIF